MNFRFDKNERNCRGRTRSSSYSHGAVQDRAVVFSPVGRHAESFLAYATESNAKLMYHIRTNENNRHIGTTYFHLPQGTILELPGRERFTSAGNVHDLYVAVTVGVHDPPTKIAMMRSGMCLISAASASVLEFAMTSASNAFNEHSLVAPTFDGRAEQREFQRAHEVSLGRLL